VDLFVEVKKKFSIGPAEGTGGNDKSLKKSTFRGFDLSDVSLQGKVSGEDRRISPSSQRDAP